MPEQRVNETQLATENASNSDHFEFGGNNNSKCHKQQTSIAILLVFSLKVKKRSKA